MQVIFIKKHCLSILLKTQIESSWPNIWTFAFCGFNILMMKIKLIRITTAICACSSHYIYEWISAIVRNWVISMPSSHSALKAIWTLHFKGVSSNVHVLARIENLDFGKLICNGGTRNNTAKNISKSLVFILKPELNFTRFWYSATTHCIRPVHSRVLQRTLSEI